MMKINKLEIFNTRDRTTSYKWHQCSEDMIPMGVADMDFKMADSILESMKFSLLQGDFGYGIFDDYFQSVCKWMKKRYDWDVSTEWVTFSPGTMTGIAILIRLLTRKRDSVMILSPVYSSFFSTIKNNGRIPIESQLIYSDGKYELDFEDIENKISYNNIKLLILSNPHNPVGRVWSREEQIEICDICKKYGVYIISDEIHADMTMHEYVHIPFLKYNMNYSDHIIVSTSPSKAFNMPSMYIANFIIPNEVICELFKNIIKAEPTILGSEALKTAYDKCDDWLGETIDYIENNYRILKITFKAHMPKIKLVSPQATYLAWLDCTQLNMKQSELMSFFYDKAKLYVNNGEDYGKGGQGFVRMNIACHKHKLNEALVRLKQAYEEKLRV